MQIYFCVFYRTDHAARSILWPADAADVLSPGLMFNICKCATLKMSNIFFHYEQQHSTHQSTDRGMGTGRLIFVCLFLLEDFAHDSSRLTEHVWKSSCEGVCVWVCEHVCCVGVYVALCI